MAALVAFAGEGVALCIYSTSSATADAPRWRGLIPLPEPLGFAHWKKLQQALHLHLESSGIKFDVSMERAGQYFAAPNVPPEKRDADGVPVFYQYEVIEGEPLDILSCGVVDAMAALEAEESKAQEAAQEARKRTEERRTSKGFASHGSGLIDAVNERNSVAACFARYGFDSDDGENWHRPQQSSGSYSWRDYGEHWVCASSMAREARIGAVSANGFAYGDAFDLMVYFDHRGYRDAAFKALALEIEVTDPESGEILSWHDKTRKEWIAEKDKLPDFEPIDLSALLAGVKPWNTTDAPEPYPGPMADMVQAILATSRRQQPALALCAALAAMAAACPGKFYLPGGGRLNLYVLGVIDTGMGKEHPRHTAEGIAAAAGATVIGGPASGEGLEDALPENPDTGLLVAVDEVAHLLGNMTDVNAAAYMRTLSANLLRLFSAGAAGYRGRVKAGYLSKLFKHPSVSLLGFSTPQKLGTAVSTANVTDGLLGRMLVLFGDESAKPQRPMAEFWTPKSVKAAADLINAQRNTWTKVLCDESADALLGQLLTEVEVGAADHIDAALRRRSFEKIDRIAGVLAVWDCPPHPVVNVDHVHWAHAMVNASNAAMLRFMRQHMHEGEVQGNAAKVLDLCQRILKNDVTPDRGLESEAISQGGVPRSLVLKRSKLSAKQLADATQQLMMQGDLTLSDFTGMNGNKCAVFGVL